MTALNRRRFIQATAALPVAGAFATATTARASRVLGANDSVTLGFIGVGGMGTGLLNIFNGFPDVGRRGRRVRTARPAGQRGRRR